MAPLVDLSQVNTNDGMQSQTIKWRDENKGTLSEEGPDEEDLVNLVNPPPI